MSTLYFFNYIYACTEFLVNNILKSGKQICFVAAVEGNLDIKINI